MPEECAKARVDLGAGVQLVAVHLDAHDPFLHGRVARALAQAVDGAFHLGCTVLHARQRQRGGHAEVVVAVHRHRGLLDAVHMVHEVLDARAELLGQRVARGVGDVHHRGAGLDDGFDDAHEEVVVGAARVLGVELYVLDEVAGVLHALDRTLDALVLGNAQLVAQVARAHADAGMDARTLGVLERVGRGVDVLLHRAREAAHRCLVACELRDAADGLEVAGARDGEARLDDVHVEPEKLTRHDQLLLGVHGGARRLLAVAKRRIEDVDLARHMRVPSFSARYSLTIIANIPSALLGIRPERTNKSGKTTGRRLARKRPGKRGDRLPGRDAAACSERRSRTLAGG